MNQNLFVWIARLIEGIDTVANGILGVTAAEQHLFYGFSASIILIAVVGDFENFQDGGLIPLVGLDAQAQIMGDAIQSDGHLLGKAVAGTPASFGDQVLGGWVVFAAGQDGLLDIELGYRRPVEKLPRGKKPDCPARCLASSYLNLHKFVADRIRASIKGAARQRALNRHESVVARIVSVPSAVFEIARVTVGRVEGVVEALVRFKGGVVVGHIVHTGGIVDHQQHVGVRALRQKWGFGGIETAIAIGRQPI